jgi:hypothetical protein
VAFFSFLGRNTGTSGKREHVLDCRKSVVYPPLCYADLAVGAVVDGVISHVHTNGTIHSHSD